MSPRHRQVTYSQRPNHAARAAHAKGEKAFRTYDTSFIRPKRSKVPAIIGVLVLVAVVSLAVWGVLTFAHGCSFEEEGTLIGSDETAEVVVLEGEHANDIAISLREAGLIARASDFTDRVKELNVGSALKVGTYVIAGGTSVDDIIALLQTGVLATTFTVPEGSTIAQTAQIVESGTKGLVSADAFEGAAADASVYATDYPFLESAGTRSLEGFLFPKTYAYGKNSTADSLIRAMLAQYAQEIAVLDYGHAKGQGLSAYDVLKLASIIEKEADAEHRNAVASVFYNRLAKGMRLQSDATVAYFAGQDPTPDDVKTEHPYNTYTIDGLPPTPINSPGIEALRAACAPDDTPYLYFYFAPDAAGVMQYHFSETYEEHQSTYAAS